ncbi:MAG: hypothetical protein NTY19_22830, partial [Planctomycetota bacterium]|nr:hypothetical protein [Planctomycetota bacterium]
VSVASSDATVTLPASVTFEQGRASFVVTFATAGSQTLTVTDSNDATLTGQAITNVVAPAVATQLAVLLPENVPSGVAVTVQLVALDAQRHLVSSYSGTVSVASSDATVTLPASVTFEQGRASFVVTFATAGSQTLTVTDSQDATLTGQASTTVAAPAVATQLAVQLPPTVPTGVVVTVQLVALDAQRHLVSSYSGTVSVASSDSTAILPVSVTFEQGRASFVVTFATAGSQTLTVTDSQDATLTGQATTNVVAPAVATQLAVQLPPTVRLGVAVTVQLVALDAQRHLVSSYTGTVSMTSSDANATLPTSVTFAQGRASFEVTFATAGSQTLTVTDSNEATLTGQATTNVVAPAAATQLAVHLPQDVPTGVAVTVQLVALDAQRHLVSSYAGTVNVSSSDATATLPASVTFQQGRASFVVTFATAGSQTLTVTDSQDATLTGQATTNVVAPAVATQLAVQLPPTVPTGVAVTVQLVALDAQRHLVSNYSGTVNVSSSDTNATLPASVTFKNGYASLAVTFTTVGSQTLTVTDSANSSLSGQATTNVGSTPPTTGEFNIDLNFTGMTASEQQIARQAAARWEAVIVGDLPAVNYHGGTIDDVLINIGLQNMDGSGGILGEGGPDAVRAGDGLPYLGTITIDTADVAMLERQGELLNVLTHEIGHVLGLGTVWDSKGLVGGTSSNPLFIGPQATAAYNAVFGTQATGVPLESNGRPGDGTFGAHWSLSVFHNELMVGYIQPSGMPLSSITVASMADIGYQVNMAAAEPYRPTGVTSSIVAPSTSSVSSGGTSLSSPTTWLPTGSAGDPAPVATGREHHRHAPAGSGESTSAGSTSTNQIAVGTRRHARSATVDLAFQETGWWFEA